MANDAKGNTQVLNVTKGRWMPKGFTFLGAEFQINTTWDRNQKNPSIASIADGGYVVAWMSSSQDGSGFGIYGQKFDATGDTVGTEFQANTTWWENQTGPSVAGGDGNRFLVTWDSNEQDGSGYGVFGQLFDGAQNKQSGEFQINTSTFSYQGDPSVATLATGGYVVAWDSGHLSGFIHGIFGQRLDAKGNKVGAEFKIDTTEASIHGSPEIAGLVGGGFVATWESRAGDSATARVFGQLFADNGAKIGSEFLISSHVSRDQVGPSVTGLSGGGFVVNWTSLDKENDTVVFRILGQVFDVNGAPVGSKFQVNTFAPDWKYDVDVTPLADGGFVVTWESKGQDGSDKGIFGQRYDAKADRVGAEIQVNTYSADLQSEPSIAGLSNGGFVVSWMSFNQDGMFGGIFGQQFAPQLFGTSDGETIKDTVEANWVNGQAGNDIVKGLGGNDRLFGAGGKDTLYGHRGSDTLDGGIGNDNLSGNRGKDTLDGGKGRDTLKGGSGADTFVFKGGYGKDKITDFQDDIDRIHLDKGLWTGALTKQQVVDQFASVVNGNVVFDFGGDELALKGFSILSEIKDDIVLI